jgi:hypothetical protein
MSGRKGRTAQERRRTRRAAERQGLTAAASGATGLPLSDRDTAWDAGAARKGLSENQYGRAHFWRDPDGDANTISAYKLPFAKNNPPLTAVWRGVTAAAGAIQGARGGVNIPQDDVAGVKSRIGSYYAKARKKYDDPNLKPPWDAAEGESAAALLAYAELGPGVGETDEEIGAEQAEFAERVKFWQAELGEPADAVLDTEALRMRSLLENTREALQHNARCSCGHWLSEHTGADGPCNHKDGRGVCSCSAFSEMAAEVEPGFTDDGAAQFECSGCGSRSESRRSPLDVPIGSPDLAERMKLRLEDFALEVADEPLAEGMEPREELPDRHPSPEAPEVDHVPGRAVRWTATLVPEGSLTDDGRAIAPGALTWRELPLTLMAMIETTEGGHLGAEVAGRIDRIWRDEASGLIRGEGVFDDGEYGAEIARLVDDRTLSGVSVDLAIHQYEVGPKSDWFDEDGNWAPGENSTREDEEEPSLIDLLFGEEGDDTIFVVTEAVIGAVTVCPFQAFADAKIEVAASLVAGASPGIWTVTSQAGFVTIRLPAEALTASAVEPEPEPPEAITAAAAGLAPVLPPAEWFENPQLEELTPLTVDEDGRIYGHAWAWDTCHIGIPGVCTTAPTSQTGYSYFLLKQIECDDGERVCVGTVTLDTGHADRRMGQEQAAAHYDHTGVAVADVVVGEDEHGGWVAGALRPNVDAEKARALRGAVLSGDWRNVDGNLELVALLAVNVPGFPVPRTRALVAAGDDGNEVLALVAAGIHTGELSQEDRSKIEALRARADGRFAELAARAAAE